MDHPFLVIAFCFGIGAAVTLFAVLLAVWADNQNDKPRRSNKP